MNKCKGMPERIRGESRRPGSLSGIPSMGEDRP